MPEANKQNVGMLKKKIFNIFKLDGTTKFKMSCIQDRCKSSSKCGV